MPHTPPVHVAVPWVGDGHAWPQAPQLFTSVLVLTQALPTLQNPELHVPTPHTPPLQPAVPLGIDGHTFPQAPQLFTSALVFVLTQVEPTAQ